MSLGIEARDQPFGIAVRFILFNHLFILLTCHPVATLLPGLFTTNKAFWATNCMEFEYHSFEAVLVIDSSKS